MFLSTAVLLHASLALSPLSFGTAGTAPVVEPTATAEAVTWFQGNLSAAVAEARKQEGLVLLYFWRDGSEYCAKLYQETLSDPAAAAALSNVVCYSANHGDKKGAELIERFKIQTLPAMLFLGPDGSPEDSIVGFIPPAAFQEEVARIQRGERTLSGLKKLAAAAEGQPGEDFTERFQLAGKHQELGQAEEHDAILASIREADPKSKTVIGARVHMWNIVAEISKAAQGKEGAEAEDGADGYSDGDGDLTKWDLKPLYKHAAAVKPTEAKFEVWDRIASLEAGREQYGKAMDGYEKALKYVPEERAMYWCEGVSKWILQGAEERTSKEKKFALELAERSVKIARHLDPESDSYSEAYGDYRKESILAERLSTLAWALHTNGMEDQAVVALNECIELDPEGGYEAFLAELEQA